MSCVAVAQAHSTVPRTELAVNTFLLNETSKLAFAFILGPTYGAFSAPQNKTHTPILCDPRRWHQNLRSAFGTSRERNFFPRQFCSLYTSVALRFSSSCFCTEDICIKTESLLLSNSSAPAARVLFPIKILRSQPSHRFYKELSDLAPAPRRAPRSHAMLLLVFLS